MSTRSEPDSVDSGGNRPDPGLKAVISERRRLINLTYRMLGSLTEAEDAVQETYARWYAMSREQQDAIDSPGAWLTTVASRICLTQLGSARARREAYVGEWIPEPLPERTEWVSGWGGGERLAWGGGSPSRCRNARSGSAGGRAATGTRPTGSPSTSRSTWPSSS